MAIKEQPIGFREYWKSMKAYYSNLLSKSIERFDVVTKEKNVLYDEIKENYQIYLTNYNFDLFKYDEFVNNVYDSGKLLRAANNAYLNKNNNYELTYTLFHLLRYCKLQKEEFELNKNIEFYKKLSNIKCLEYAKVLNKFYSEVHRKLVLEGAGYVFGNNIGWTCFNRCHIEETRRKLIDFSATKKREAELLAAGKRIYNKEEAEWCEKNGIEYVAEDKRVFRNEEYCYELPLIDCKLPNGTKFKMETLNYKPPYFRGKTYNDVLKDCGYNKENICNLNVDVKTKLTLCLKVDNLLYTKFIRNENQKPLNARKTNRKDRQ